jgi:hypothetical protein
VSTIYDIHADSGVNFNSFGFDWGIDNPIVSDRDNAFIGLEEFSIKLPL